MLRQLKRQRIPGKLCCFTRFRALLRQRPTVSPEPAPVPSESVSFLLDSESEEPSIYEEPSAYEEPSSVYEEPSSQYYEEPSSDDYEYNYEDSSTYTDSAITDLCFLRLSADGASGTTK